MNASQVYVLVILLLIVTLIGGSIGRTAQRMPGPVPDLFGWVPWARCTCLTCQYDLMGARYTVLYGYWTWLNQDGLGFVEDLDCRLRDGVWSVPCAECWQVQLQ
jgi:hypothetical protein